MRRPSYPTTMEHDPHTVWKHDSDPQLFARLRLLTSLRDAVVDMANTADIHDDGVSFDKRAFDRVIRTINRLMNFEGTPH